MLFIILIKSRSLYNGIKKKSYFDSSNEIFIIKYNKLLYTVKI